MYTLKFIRVLDLETPPPLFDVKLVYSYVIEFADSESDFGLHGKALVSEILLFIRIRVTYILVFLQIRLTYIYLQLNTFLHYYSKK